uniref:Uncharacterized protein n=1 Tax=Micrurus lemniscatus lemniscatus TaxID=129467 RepID=A0A2D4IGP4_MICLE
MKQSDSTIKNCISFFFMNLLGHPNMGGPMQRMTPPRGMVPLGPQNYGGAMRPPLNALAGPGMPGMNMGPGGGRPWPNPTNANSIPYSSASPGNYVVSMCVCTFMCAMLLSVHTSFCSV